MKKLMLSFAVIAISMSAKSQVRLGVQAGASINSPTVSGLGNVATKKITTVSPGIVFEVPMGPLSFRPSVNYLAGNTTFQENIPAAGLIPATLQVDQIITKNVQIPLDITLPIKAGKGKILIAVGPVVTIGLKAEVASTVSVASSGSTLSTGSAPLQFGNASSEIKKVDWGGRFGVGYRLNKFDILAQYKLGFTNQLNGAGENLKNHIVSLTASWFLFGGQK
jgi:Outer membrane protein beta-barrel domain